MTLQLAACLYSIIHCLFVYPLTGSVMMFEFFFKLVWHIKSNYVAYLTMQMYFFVNCTG